jgi:uncharacterized membrane protein YraQ (UPF0718 family)
LYKSIWVLLFGVLITAIIDVFVDKDKIAKLLGGHDFKPVTVATGLGAASSACTFGAVTVGQALFKKGASVVSTLAFSMAATNIVFELGILIYVLLGPYYLAAELLSGIILIYIMYFIVKWTLPSKTFDAARKRLNEQDNGESNHQSVDLLSDRGSKLYLIAERYFKTIGQIRKSVIFGFLVAGFIIIFVPTSFWTAVFPESSSFFGILGNASLGVLAGVFSFIGSIGIVPFAVALGAGGVAFAGVLGCIVADLITIPVLGAWKKFFGWKATFYIGVVFYTTMVLSTVFITYLFVTFNWLPDPITGGEIVNPPDIGLNWKTIMTAVMFTITAVLYLIKRKGSQRNAEE